MDIYECRDRFGITLRKLRKMEKAGVLKIEKDKTPEYWRKVISDIQKGKMSARSIALALKFPEKLARLRNLTRVNRGTIQSHFSNLGLPDDNLGYFDIRSPDPCGTVEKIPAYRDRFIEALQKIVPDYDVPYEYIAVRMLLTCEFDFHISGMSDYMTRAFSAVRDEPSMIGWWHKEPGKYGKNHIIYHRPRSYDL